MAWFDMVGGIAQGVQQGLGQIDQRMQRQKLEQEKAQEAFLTAVQQGRIDPLNVPAEVLQSLSPQQAKSLLVKDPTANTLQMRMEPTQLGKLQRTRAAEKNFYGEAFANLPPEQQVIIAAQAGVSPQEAYLRMSPQARSVFAAAAKPSKTPEISDLQNYVNSLTTQLKNAQDARKEMFGNTPQIKQQREELDAQINQLRNELATGKAYIASAVGGGTFTNAVRTPSATAQAGGYTVGQQLRNKTTGAVSVVTGLRPDGTPILSAK